MKINALLTTPVSAAHEADSTSSPSTEKWTVRLANHHIPVPITQPPIATDGNPARTHQHQVILHALHASRDERNYRDATLEVRTENQRATGRTLAYDTWSENQTARTGVAPDLRVEVHLGLDRDNTVSRCTVRGKDSTGEDATYSADFGASARRESVYSPASPADGGASRAASGAGRTAPAWLASLLSSDSPEGTPAPASEPDPLTGSSRKQKGRAIATASESSGDEEANPAKRRKTSTGSSGASTPSAPGDAGRASSVKSDESALEDFLVDQCGDRSIYGENRSTAVATQVQYLARHINVNKGKITKIDEADFDARWQNLERLGAITASEMDEGPKVVEITDGNMAVGSIGAAPCIVVLVKAVTENDDEGKRTFMGSIHVSNADSSDQPFDVMDAYEQIFKKLDTAIQGLHGGATQREYYLIGGSTESRESCVAVAHAAELLDLNVEASLLPTNRSGQVIDTLLTTEGLFYSQGDVEEDDPVPEGMYWLQPGWTPAASGSTAFQPDHEPEQGPSPRRGWTADSAE